MKTSNHGKTVIGGALATAALIGSFLGPGIAHAEPQGYLQEVYAVGLVYGTFEEEGSNLTLLVGGTVEEFCPADPGTAPMRVFPRRNGTVDLKVNDKGQPIYLYEQTVGDSFDWIDSVCTDVFDDDPDTNAPAPDAIGSADLKVRISIISEDLVDVFNSVNGELVASDGTEYRVRASADFVVENGVLLGDPADFVSLKLTEIRR